MPTINLVLAGVPFEIETPSLRLTELFADYYRYYEPGVVYANGGATVVWVDFPRQKSVPMSDQARALIEAAGGPPRLTST